MEISVVVPTYNNREVLRETILHLCRQTFPRDAYEIIVVDDGSTDGTPEMVAALAGDAGASCGPTRGPQPCNKSRLVPLGGGAATAEHAADGADAPFPVMRCVTQANGGRAAARNLGVRTARGRIVLFVDSDLWAAPDLLAEHYRHYPADASRRGAQGKAITHPDSRVTPFMRVKEITPDLTMRRRRDLSPFHVTTRNCSMLRRDVLDAGGFDETFGGYGWEDIELAIRMHALGVRFEYEPRALGHHHHVEDLRGVRDKLRQAGAGAVYFWRKYRRSTRIGVFLEIAPFMLPVKWLVYRTPLVTPFIRWLVPRAESRGWLLVLNECYSFLLWEAYYEGVFRALRSSRPEAAGPSGAAAPVRPATGRSEARRETPTTLR